MAGVSLSPLAAAGFSLLGTATGLRSLTGMAAVVVFTPRAAIPSPLRHEAVRPVALALAVGELIGDKLPNAPTRTEPLGLAGRLGFGAVSSGVLAASTGRGAAVPAAIGAGSALGAAFAGLAMRSALTRRLGPFAAAVTEDLITFGLTAAALRLVGPPPPAPDDVSARH
jgi:uncharacterized membrane protein